MATECATVDSDLRSLCEEDTIRHILVTFMPYIVDCIQVTDLLAYLHYYTNDQRKEIFQTSGRNQQEATRKAIHILLDDFDDPGRFTAFREMAKERGYPKIECILSGAYIPDDENYRKIIDLFTQPITKRLNPVDLLPSLIKYGVVLQREAEMVRADELNFGKTRASWLLVLFLPRNVDNWFRLFLESLIECREQDLANMLDPDLYKKIMTQRKHCIQNASISSTVSEATCSYVQDFEKEVDKTETNNKPLVDVATQTEELKDLKPPQNSDLFTDMKLAPIEMEDLKFGIHASEAQTQCSIEQSAKLKLAKELPKKCDLPVPPNNNKITRQNYIEEKENNENNIDTTTGVITSGKDECKKSNVEETSLKLVINRPDHVNEFSEGVILSPNVVEDSNIDETKLKAIYRCEPDNHEHSTIIENDLIGSPYGSLAESKEVNAECIIGDETVEVMDTNTAIKQIPDAVDAFDIGSPILITGSQQYLDLGQNVWHAEMSEMQRINKKEAERKCARRVSLKNDQNAELQCLNCSSFICMASDIKRIHNCHYVILGKTVEERDMYRGFFCKGEGCGGYILGGAIQYKSCELPLVKICNFRVVYQSGKAEHHKKWMNAKFRVEAFTLDDLRKMFEERRN